MKADSLGDRMKGQYEDRTRYMLPRRTFTILRADGKAFHTFTRHCQKPYDARFVEAMDAAALELCREAQGACFGYVQSDEISVILTDFATITTEAWFDGNLQKVVSVAASVVTAAFNAQYSDGTSEHHAARFDCRAFTIPDPVEVENYFIWRQQDAVRNSIQGLAQSKFSQKQLHGVSTAQAQELLFQQHGVNWNATPTEQKRGRGIVYTSEDGWFVDREIPTFTQDRDYIRRSITLPDPPPTERPRPEPETTP